MNFTPLSEDQITKLSLLEKGEYPFEVRDAKQKTSSKGNEMLELILCIWDKEGREHIVYDYLMEAFLFKLKHFADAVGLADKYDLGKIEFHECIGKQGVCKIYIKEDKSGQYTAKNAVADYVRQGTLITKAESINNKQQFDDEIPF